jgi:hypothetical protein
MNLAGKWKAVKSSGLSPVEKQNSKELNRKGAKNAKKNERANLASWRFKFSLSTRLLKEL